MPTPLAASVRRFDAEGGLIRLQRRLRSASTVSELLAIGALEACSFCGFSRGVVLTVDGDRLVADGTAALADPDCDALRRRALASPIALIPDSYEAELIRRAEGLAHGRAPTTSVLSKALGLRSYTVAPILPEFRVVALLVLDRPELAVDDDDRSLVELFSHLLGQALERTVLRARLDELSTELRHMTASANALLQEAVTAPVTVTTDFGGAPVFVTTVGAHGPTPAQLGELLTARELEIVELMAKGRSNRAIADELHLAPNTIKSHVARILRKLGASNRAEAVGRYLTLRQASGGGSASIQ